jgi:Right handed beta helix region
MDTRADGEAARSAGARARGARFRLLSARVVLFAGALVAATGCAPAGSFVVVKATAADIALAPATGGSSSPAQWYVAPNGSDSNPCKRARPCATPEYVFDHKAAPGETVEVAAGTYSYGSGALRLKSSGAPGRYKVLSCATRGACKITNSVTGNHTVVYLEGSYIAFDGFEVTNSGSGNNLGIYVTSQRGVQITRNTIHHIETDCGENGGGGIQLASGDRVAGSGTDMLIDSNLIYDISWSSCQGSSSVQTDGILAETSAGGVTITNNIVYHVAGGWGITMSNGSGNARPMVVKNNTVFSNGNGGITLVRGTVPPIITNNIVVNNGLINPKCGINLPPGLSGVVGHNYLWKNAGGNYCVEWDTSDQSVHGDDLSVDPGLGTIFVDWKADGSGDYHLKAGSPAMGLGSGRL